MIRGPFCTFFSEILSCCCISHFRNHEHLWEVARYNFYVLILLTSPTSLFAACSNWQQRSAHGSARYSSCTERENVRTISQNVWEKSANTPLNISTRWKSKNGTRSNTAFIMFNVFQFKRTFLKVANFTFPLTVMAKNLKRWSISLMKTRRCNNKQKQT